MPPGAGRPAFTPGHNYSQSSPDMSAISQPQLPSALMARASVAQNPFEQDEVEPMGSGRVRPPGALPSKGALGMEGAGVVAPNRAKFSRATAR
jgi:hypothetical protein